ncbi:MAG: tetratricopeptide repeat protein [Burkholderiales bacterium]|nr:tetratricopeptide repeat protein [Burkholderiales bacterium]
MSVFARLFAALVPRREVRRSAADWCDDGAAHVGRGEFAEAVVCFERALALEPDSIVALHARAALHHACGEYAEAIELCDEVLARVPASVDTLCTRAFALRSLGRLVEALADFERAAALEARAGLIACVGGVLFQLGRLDAALKETERALAADPEADHIHSNRLFMLNHVPGLSRRAIADEHFAWGWALERRKSAAWLPHANDPDPRRRLRVAYVSADLRVHSVAFFIAAVLANHDRSEVEVYCYDNQTGRGDAMTERLAAHVDHWVRIDRLDDAAFAARIRADAIDVLVDLSGHTGGNRLPVFAMRPAPVQASWFGYMNTTGLAVIDYRITDAVFGAPEDQALYSERLFRLPSMFNWVPADESPPCGDSPWCANGHVRFGSFNNLTKVGDAAITAWARVINAVPGSRLVVIAAGADEPVRRAGVVERFTRAGLGAERLEIHAHQPLAGFLRLVREVDIAFDPFPYNGGTTTLHTLWMGVPIVSLACEEEIGRVSRAILSSIGLADLCAPDLEAYVATAISLATDTERLQALRGELRSRMTASPYLDARGLARELEFGFRTMWHVWLRRQADRAHVAQTPGPAGGSPSPDFARLCDAVRSTVGPGTPAVLDPQTRLADLCEWDASNVLALCVMFDADFGRTLSRADLLGCSTLADLHRLVC